MLTLTTTQKCGLAIEKTPTNGRIDDVPVFTVTDPAILRVDAAPDGLTATVFALGPEGPCTVTALCHANGRELTATLDVVVAAPVVFADSIAIVPGTPEEQ